MDDIQDQTGRDSPVALDQESSSSDLYDYSESDQESSDFNSPEISDGESAFDNKSRIKITEAKKSREIDPNIDSIFGSYKIIARIEASTLYKCFNPQTPEIIYKANVVTTENKFQFMATYERLKHNPRVNKILEIITHQEKSLVVYKRTYADLHSYLTVNKKLQEPHAAQLFQQILTIMADLHRAGIILRELKIRRFVFKDEQLTTLVLESWDGAILLNDPEIDTITEKCGCPPYVSPEILISREISYSGKKSNSWAVGVMLHTILTNQYPFTTCNYRSMFYKISRCLYTVPEYLSPAAKSLLKGLLCPDPANRLSILDALEHDWIRHHCNRNHDNQMVASSSSSSHPPFGNLSLPGFSRSRHEGESYNMANSNLQQDNNASSSSSSSSIGGAFSAIHQPSRGVEPQESNRVAYSLFPHDQLVPFLPRTDIDSPPSFISPPQQSSSSSTSLPREAMSTPPFLPRK